jgi:hypothetical protein
VLACAPEVGFYEPVGEFRNVSPSAFLGRSSGHAIGPMHWYAAILLLLGLFCGLRVPLLAFALLIVSIVVAIAAYGHWNRTPYSEMAIGMVVAAVALQIGYVLGVLGQIVFRRLRLPPDQKRSSSENN